MKPWLRRFKAHALECLGHIAWGAGAGLVGGVDGFGLLMGGFLYQLGSGWRKQQAGDIDTVGMDCFDYAIGYLGGVMVRKLFSDALPCFRGF